MKKAICLFLLFLMPLGLVFGTGSRESAVSPASETPSTRVVKDMLGNEIVLPAKGATYAVFGGPVSQIPAMLGVSDSVVAVTKGAQMMELMRLVDPTIVNKPAPRSTSGNVNVEELLLADPDCVISFDTDGNIVKNQTSIPVIFLEGGDMSVTIDEMKEEVRFFGKVFDAEERAEVFVQFLEKTVAMLEKRLSGLPADKQKRIFIGEGPSHLATLGGDTFITHWLKAAGLKNAVLDIQTTTEHQEGLHSGFLEISMEQVIKSNPDIIIIDTGKPEEIYNSPRWQGIKAVQNKQVYNIPTGIFLWTRPSAESVVLYPVWLAVKAYPELFSDFSMVDFMKDFYKTVFNYEISDENAERVIQSKMGRVVFSQIDRKP